MIDLTGKAALVTGGSRGIGKAIGLRLARQGADVAFSYNSREDLAAATSEKIEGYGRKAFNARVSVVDRVGMKKLTRELVEKWGGIDILVNNAAINRGDNFATTTDRAWDEVIHTNVDSLFAVTKPIYKQMIRQRKGIILNITSIGAMRALAEHGRHVPWDVAVVGFDDIPMARFASPPLTSVIQDTTRAGELLVETLLKLVRGETVDSVMLPPTLVVRRSSTGA